MNLNELIKKLQDIKKEHGGDIDTMLPEYEYRTYVKITDADVTHKVDAEKDQFVSSQADTYKFVVLKYKIE